MLEIAVLGGYVERKEKQPGAKTIWRGFNRLHDLATMFSIMNNIQFAKGINHEKAGYG